MTFLRLFFYFLLVVIIGGIGFWIPLGQHIYDPNTFSIYIFIGNLGTFSISVAVMAFADFLLYSANDYSSARGLFLLLLMAMAVGLSILGIVWAQPFIIKVALAGLGVSLFQWWVVEWNNPSFGETVIPENSMGGKL